MTIICTQCNGNSTVIDSRHNDKGIKRRRRVCKECEYRWSTVEVTEGTLLLEASTKRFIKFREELNEIIERFIDGQYHP